MVESFFLEKTNPLRFHFGHGFFHVHFYFIGPFIRKKKIWLHNSVAFV
jgi:hypothetical protein